MGSEKYGMQDTSGSGSTVILPSVQHFSWEK